MMPSVDIWRALSGNTRAIAERHFLIWEKYDIVGVSSIYIEGAMAW